MATPLGMLGKLPLELREEIYGNLFATGHGVELSRASRAFYDDTKGELSRSATYRLPIKYDLNFEGATYRPEPIISGIEAARNLEIQFSADNKYTGREGYDLDGIWSFIDTLQGRMKKPKSCRILFEFRGTHSIGEATLCKLEMFRGFQNVSVELTNVFSVRLPVGNTLQHWSDRADTTTKTVKQALERKGQSNPRWTVSNVIKTVVQDNKQGRTTTERMRSVRGSIEKDPWKKNGSTRRIIT